MKEDFIMLWYREWEDCSDGERRGYGDEEGKNMVMKRGEGMAIRGGGYGDKEEGGYGDEGGGCG